MKILTIRTDKPAAEVGLYEDNKQLDYLTWKAHRQLGVTLNSRILEILNKSSIGLEQVGGIICFKGPGSFTGLRIGLSVANALAYSLNIPIVARQDPRWLEIGLRDLLAGQNDKIALPEYGAPATTTTPK